MWSALTNEADAPRLLIGVVHLEALPGAPLYAGSMEGPLAAAERDAGALREGGCDALIVENFGDRPFFAGAVPAETIAAMARALEVVRAAAPGAAIGVNVLRNDVRAALGLAAACEARFVRVNVHVGAAVTDQGLIEGRAAESVRERARLCPEVAIFADVHVKHATPLGAESTADSAAEALERGLADAVVVTGSATGAPPGPELVAAVRARIGSARLLIGSGVTASSAAALVGPADGAIVGTALKQGGRVDEPVDPARVSELRRAIDALPPREWRAVR